MLVWTASGKALAWGILLALFGVFYAVPIATIILASLAGDWSGVLPSHLTFANYASAVHGEEGESLRVSLITGALSSFIALLIGAWAALALRAPPGAKPSRLNILFFVPSAVPSVSVGLALLVAFSRPPLALNATVAIVIIAHLVLISAFTFGNISAGLSRLPPDFEQVAESLGATPVYRLRKVTIPLLAPYLIASFSLSFALSMGELGATVMVYPPGWVTLPVHIFALTDRGEVFQGAALTMLLAFATLAVLLGLAAIPTRAAPRR
jgi:2-aminoethylphosphonate transport system permease protein